MYRIEVYILSTVVERLSALRALMKEKNLQAYIICTDDFHGSEYVGSYFKARAIMSGFTGSAGTLVVLPDEAGLWTDGRYFLQGAAQLEGSTITLMKMGEEGVPTIAEFLADKLADGSNIGFDGRTVTDAFMSGITKKISGRNMSYVCGEDLVDKIWTDRPALSKEPVWELSVEYAGMSREEKLGKIRESIKKEGADLLVLTALDDIAWLLNLRGNDVAYNPVFLSYMTMTDDSAVLYLDESIFNADIKGKLAADGIELRPYNDIYSDLKKVGKDEVVLVDKATANFLIVHSLPNADNVRAVQSPVVLPKAIKTVAERENEKKAHVKDGMAVTHFMYWLKKNVGRLDITEMSAAVKLDEFRKKQPGYLGESFDPIMGYGAHGAIVHYSATEETNAKLETRSFLLSDTGGHYYEGTTDITRTIALGELTDEEKKVFTLVLKGHLNLANAQFLYGARGENLDYIAREPLWRNGMDYNHGTGHGVGYLLNVHERPNGIRTKIAPSGPSAVLEEGMITSDEPGMYIAGKFGVRHENLVLCVKREKTEYGQFMGFEPLTMVPFDLDAVDVSYMTAEEKERLNAYHAKVFAAISPDFEGEELEWLKNATRAV